MITISLSLRNLLAIALVLAILAGGALLALPLAAGIRVVVEYFAEVKQGNGQARSDAADAAAEAAPADQAFAPDQGSARSGEGVPATRAG